MTVDRKKSYTIDRKTAAERLNVSIRTLDRYVKHGKLSTQQRDGRKWLCEKELDERVQNERVDSVDTFDASVSMDTEASNRDSSVHMVSTPLSASSTSSKEKQIYKRLYEELQQEFRHQQERVEHANYRVGQLEAQLKSSVSLLEYNNQRNNHREIKEALDMEINDFRSELKTVQKELKSERLTKIIYLAILFIILVLQPLWLWLSVVK